MTNKRFDEGTTIHRIFEERSIINKKNSQREYDQGIMTNRKINRGTMIKYGTQEIWHKKYDQHEL